MTDLRDTLKTVSAGKTCIGGDLTYMEEMEDDAAKKPNMQSLCRTSRHFVSEPDSMDLDEGDGDHSDSGVFNSSKNTTGSTSDTDLTDDSENRVGLIHYFNTSTETKKSTKPNNIKTNHSICDASYDVESDTASQNDSDSPRSEMPGLYRDTELQEVVVHKDIHMPAKCWQATEMKTFTPMGKRDIDNLRARLNNERQYDEVFTVEDDDNDDSLRGVDVHENLRGRGCHSPFARLAAEDEEDDHTNVTTRRLVGRTHREVDAGVGFSLNRNDAYRYSSSPLGSGSRTKTSETGPSKLPYGPPFDDPVSFTKVKGSAEKLIDFKRSDRDIPNMPPGAQIRDLTNDDYDSGPEDKKDGSLNDSTTKKRKKKKKPNGKDDAGDSDLSRASKEASYDVNGNPTDFRSSSRSLVTSSIDKSDGFLSDHRHLNSRQHESSHFPRDVQMLETYPYNGQSVVDMHSSSEHSLQGRGQRNRIRKKQRESQTLKAEDIPGYRGGEQIDKLVDFIENNKGGKKKKGTPPLALNGPVFGPDKNNVKRIKKHRLSGSKEGSEKGGSENGSEKGDDIIKLNDLGDEKVKDIIGEPTTVNSDLIKDHLVLPLDKTEADHSIMANHSNESVYSVPVTAPIPSIFTDFDNAFPKEEGFTIVGKKKKVPTATLR